ncbi:unnamed protein product [Spodoptera littoralis]|uniref:Uncharacterized protein n=1 Tax=Spodoptera littoralis TaxID=7109 RepID=A0A9P0HXZ5_SPOLI|nr:unnamed protein product [Spodoptera littoralis]CAH1636255.1 unnamed protein product [Spodoptera littoralis]
MVEDKTVPEPQEFSKKIDMLKELYNKLGAQITESKSRLEHALLTARDMQSDLHALGAWLDGLGAGVGRQTLELEMSRMQALRDKLNANYASFADTADPQYADRLREQVDAINARWDHLKKHGPPAPAAPAAPAAPEAASPADGAPVVEYENVTDTIKRRLESPVNTPETEKPELKKSKIPLALKSPVPIRKEIKEGGHRSRGSSLERGKRVSESPASDCSAMSTDSIEPPPPRRPTTLRTPTTSTTPASLDTPTPISPSTLTTPDTPSTPTSPTVRNTSVTLATTTSSDTPNTPDTPSTPTSPTSPNTGAPHDTAGTPEPMDRPSTPSTPLTPSTPQQNSSTFNLLTDSDLFTQISKDKIRARAPVPAPAPAPAHPCHVVAVTEHEIVKSTVSPIEPVEIYPFEAIDAVVEFIPQTVETVEIIDDTENESLTDSDDQEQTRQAVDLGTEPKTFVVEVKTLEQRMKPTLGILKRKNSSEEENPKTLRGAMAGVPDVIPAGARAEAAAGPALPEPSATELRARASPQLRSTSCSEFEDKAPLSTSTPIKQDERSKQSVQVVAMSPKLIGDHLPKVTGDQSPTFTGGQSPKLTGDRSPESIGDQSPVLSEDQSPKLSEFGKLSDDKSSKSLDDQSPKSTDEQSVKSTRDETSKSSDEQPGSAESPESAQSVLRARWGSAADAAVLAWEAAARALLRRMDVMLVTVGGVAAERDPAKRLEILKHQLGQLAPDAAALISQGDSLVYAKHRDSPLLADYIQTHFQDKLRNKWSMVMSEIELKRNLALRAEDNLKELNKILEEAQAWPAGDGDAQDGAEMGAREACVERAAELARELRAAHVGVPERAVASLLARAAPAPGPEHVTRANRAREAVAALGAMLRAPPLGSRDYDEFPLQEDALGRVRAGLAAAAPQVAEAERELAWHAARGGAGAARAQRLHDKLRAEWAALQDHYRARHDR